MTLKETCKGEGTANSPAMPFGPIGPRRRLSGAAPPRPLDAIRASAAALVGVHAELGVLLEVPAARLSVPRQ
eukprot:6978671-Alexandrium_andersonii.AAC.1